ncbi:MAG TPA: zinc-binding dehydrogenase, partial [Pseudolabrys sp.]|nr:zinc-binding dehydrogenase [Pseudolabrys sp.]
VTGASGGLGTAAMQLAAIAGGRVIALTRSPGKTDMLRKAGAHEVVVIGPDGKFADQIDALTGGDGVDVVIDNVGSPVFWEAFQSLALHGRYAVVGQIVGERVEINLARIFFKRAQLLGVGSVSRAQLADAAQLMAQGRLRPWLDRILPLEKVAEAHELVERGAAAGRVVLMAEPSRNQT